MKMRNFEEIREFVEREIIPRYNDFDAGHDVDHVKTVIAEALKLSCHYPEVDKCILLVAAAYHDLGLAGGRQKHHILSAAIIRADERLQRWFSKEEIDTIADAAEDHRASSDHEPRTIYGRIVAEADRIIDSETIVRRTLQFGMSHEPDLDREGHYRRLMEHMQEKYAEGGYISLWLPDSPNAAPLAELRELIRDKERVTGMIDHFLDEYLKS